MSIFKILFVFFIFITIAYIGYAYGESFKNRYIQIREIIKDFTLLENEVIYNSTPLPEAFFVISKKSKEPFNRIFEKTADVLIDGSTDNAYEALEISFKENKSDVYLVHEDVLILEDFFKSLGQTGIYGQKKIFEIALKNLNINSKDAEEYSKKNTKVYRYLGICFGAMIAIFLI